MLIVARRLWAPQQKIIIEKIKEVTSLGMSLIVNNLEEALKDDVDAKVALGLVTDLGAYSIMVGGTNGPHPGSFSLVDILTHGRACAIINPYYTVFFSPNIQDQLLTLGSILQDDGYIKDYINLEDMQGKELGVAVSKGMISLNNTLGFPMTLDDS